METGAVLRVLVEDATSITNPFSAAQARKEAERAPTRGDEQVPEPYCPAKAPSTVASMAER
jgi:hypothetical protein